MSDSFVFYRSFYEALQEIDDTNAAYEVMMAIMEYAFDDNERDLEYSEARLVMKLVKPQIDANKKRRSDGAKGGRPKTSGYENENHRLEKTKPNVNVNVNENVNVNDKDNRGTRSKFVPPTIEEVTAYIQENNYKVDADRFIDFYTSKNWMVGKNKMKDWRAAVRNWSRQDVSGRQSKATNNSKIHNYEERSYDYSELLKDIVK